jgi:hypothetical protein
VAQPSLAEMKAAAAESEGPGFPPASVPKFGGVDPLGLRQINFDLMDEVLPGLNNVARHIRPFVVVAWAWRRANQLAQSQGSKTISLDRLQDFVDRIEVIYVWSQLLKDSKADLPGRSVLSSLLKADKWTFGGVNWQQRRKVRRYSTALSAPINYGPGLKMLGWVTRHTEYSDVLIPTAAAGPALDAFERQMSKHLGHPAFSKFGAVTVTASEAEEWSQDWALDAVTSLEGKAMAGMLFGATAAQCRQLVGQLILSAVADSSTTDAESLRTTMAGSPSSFVPPQHLRKTWEDFRRLQIRQLFRLSLEALFHWTLGNLGEKPKEIDALVAAFMSQLPAAAKKQNAGKWLRAGLPAHTGPTELIKRIDLALKGSAAGDLAPSIVAGLALCLTEASTGETRFERQDRLPVFRAQQELSVRAESAVDEFLRHVFESWILAQHVYWSVGRGLADARAGGKTLLRLRVILDEGGWTLARGALRSPPVPTADRLHTALSLAHESALLILD